MMIRYKEFRTGDIMNIDSTKGIYHACNVQIEDLQVEGSHPYVVRTSKNNGLRGYIKADESTLNPGETISFAQDTARMFYQKEPYFTGNKVKVMSIKGREMTENIALFLITCLNKAFSLFGWGQSYDVKVLADVKLSLPAMTVMIPDWDMLETLLKNAGGGADMSKIDTSSWKKFKLYDIFEKIVIEKIDGKANDFPTEPTSEYEIPLLTAGAENQGFARYAKRSQCPTILHNVISVSANGANTGVSFYQDKEFAVLQDAYAIKLINMDIPSHEVGLFLATCLNKLLHGNFDWFNKAGWNNVKDLEISLPATATDVPDWDYMQERIAELEQEHIAELEQECIAELERYLVAAGLNGYVLTDEDLKTLSYSGSGRDEAGVGPVDARVRKEMREFKISGVFSLCKGQRLTKADQLPGDTPFIGSTESNNGVTGYIGQKPIFKGNAITVSYNGSVGQVFYQEQPFWASDDINVLYLKDHTLDRELFGYLGASLYRAGKSFSYTFKWNLERMRDTMFTLPIQTDASGQPVIDSSKTYHPEGYVPDWDYMAAYIRAIEKLVIQDVVDFKDEFIAKARAIVDAGKEAH